MAALFAEHRFPYVVHLAAQAGVRHSLVDPFAYVDSNLTGFTNILEGCRHNGCRHLLYASSSSVYGANTRMPFSVHDNVDHPLSFYGATKKANELMAHAYAHLFGLPATGLRFFTVYGPWGRPDMAMWIFTDAIMAGRPIALFNHGNMRRDFTYVDDVVEAVVRLVERVPAANPAWSGEAPDPGSSAAPWRIYNIGNNNPVELLEVVRLLEEAIGKKAKRELLPMQPGDVPETYADVDDLMRDVGFRPSTPIAEGIARLSTGIVPTTGSESRTATSGGLSCEMRPGGRRAGREDPDQAAGRRRGPGRPAPNSNDTISPSLCRQAGIAERRDHRAFAHAPAGDRNRDDRHQDHRRHQKQRIEQRQVGADRARRAPGRQRGEKMDEERQAEYRGERARRAQDLDSAIAAAAARWRVGDQRCRMRSRSHASTTKTRPAPMQPTPITSKAARPTGLRTSSKRPGQAGDHHHGQRDHSDHAVEQTPNRPRRANWSVCPPAKCEWRRRRRWTAASG